VQAACGVTRGAEHRAQCSVWRPQGGTQADDKGIGRAQACQGSGQGVHVLMGLNVPALEARTRAHSLARVAPAELVKRAAAGAGHRFADVKTNGRA
jgi:hypothetical protein